MHEAAKVYAMGETTACLIITEVCKVIWEVLQPQYLPGVRKVNWTKIAADYLRIWQMPNCCGSVDGKHIAMQAPRKSGSQNRNFKKFFSINLMASCDAEYKFTYVNIGADGSSHDSAVFKTTDLAKMTNEEVNLWPPDACLPNTNTSFPHFFVADAAFPLSTRIQRPYPGTALSKEKEIYNYRISRARRTIENTFGIFASRWRIFHTTIIAKKSTVRYIVAAAVCLHNFLQTENEYITIESNANRIIPSTSPTIQGSNYPGRTPLFLRDVLRDYFMTVGAIACQWDKVNALQPCL